MITSRTRTRLLTGFVALTAGCLLNYVGDWLLGIKLELWLGMAGFNFLWFLDLFILPVIVGFVVSYFFGLGGKWLCYFPPLIVRSYSYYDIYYISGIPDGTSLIPLGLWGFFVIVAMECAAIGGVAGEIMVKRIYGRTEDKDTIYKKSVKKS